MANQYKGNPIYLDDLSANLDIANLAWGTTNASVMLMGIRFVNPSIGDNLKLTDINGNVVAEITADQTNKDVYSLEYNHRYSCTGLKMVATDNKRTTGNILITVR